MSEPDSPLGRFLSELSRRNVYRVAVTYGVVAFVVWQVADLLFPALEFPAWTIDFVVVLTLLGFPVALVLAWAFEVTPEGVRRTPEAGTTPSGPEAPGDEETPAASRSGGRFATAALVGLGLAAAAGAGFWYLTGGGGATEPRAGDRSIAVLPFEELGQERPSAFTEGMHDDLLTRLSNVSGLKVISRTSVQQYRDTDKTVREIARELGVKWVLEGGVQQMGQEIQVNAQLIDPRTDTHAWAEQYRRELTAESLFDLQAEITRRIASSLEARLTTGEERRVERRLTRDLEAYRLYVRGRSQLNTRTPAGLRRAIEHFRRAIERDSSFALAWAGLADARGLFPSYGSGSPTEPMPTQEAAARRALELDPDLAEAHASVGFALMSGLRPPDGPTALRHLERAVELKPSYAQAHHWLALLQLALGRREEAREHASLAVELNPRHPAARSVLVGQHIADGRHEQALAEARGIARRHPEVGWQAEIEEFALVQMGRWREVERHVRARRESGRPPNMVDWRRHAAIAAAATGDSARARRLVRELERDGKAYDAGVAHAALGEVDAAFSAFGRVEPWTQVRVMNVRYGYPAVFAPLRDDPRYRELIREINTAWGLNPDGSLPEEGGE